MIKTHPKTLVLVRNFDLGIQEHIDHGARYNSAYSTWPSMSIVPLVPGAGMEEEQKHIKFHC
jgi:hypothetical protein